MVLKDYKVTGKKGNFLQQRANKSFITNFEILNYRARVESAESKSVKEIIEQISAVKNQKYKAILSLTALLGKRISEICILQKKDISINPIDYVIKFHTITEKWREKRDKIIPISRENQLELLDLLKFFAEYYEKLPLDKLSDDTYIFGDPCFVERKRTWQKYDKTQNKYVTVEKTYKDNLMRQRVYVAAMRDGGFNAHLLRHWRASYIGHAKKEQYIGKDRLILIKSLLDFKKIESAERYLRNMTQSEMQEVF